VRLYEPAASACGLTDCESRKKCRIVAGLGGASGRRNASIGCLTVVAMPLTSSIGVLGRYNGSMRRVARRLGTLLYCCDRRLMPLVLGDYATLQVRWDMTFSLEALHRSFT